MTADWRATLERVAEKLAAGVRSMENGDYPPSLDASLALLRGLLAEPQPDEVIVRDLPYDGRIGALAEPQVNPSEDWTEQIVNVAGSLAFDQEEAAYHFRRLSEGAAPDSEAWVIRTVLENAGVVPARRAGLLAEGEESREP